MNKHQIIWTALPNGFGTDPNGNPDPNKPLLSLYISLRLKADGDGRSLSDFSGIAAEWPIRLKGLKFDVEGMGQGISANWINPNAPITGLWNALFGPTTPVKTFAFHDLSQRPVISLPAYWLSERLAAHYLEVAAASPGRLPLAASLKQLIDPASRLAEVLNKRFSGILPHERHNLWALVRTGKIESIQEALTALEDPQIANGSSPKEIASAKELLQELLFFAQTFRFLAPFAVPSSAQGKYHRPKPPDFNFHQILAIVSEYPSLLRALGLVIDLQLTGLVAPQDSFKLRVLPKWQLEEADFIVPWTHFDPTSFKPIGRDGTPSNFLPLENGEFKLTEMDGAGVAVKFAQTMQAVTRAQQDQPQGLPSLRTGGLTVAWCGQQPTYSKEGSFRVQKFTERMQTQKSLNDALAPGAQVPEFYAEDLVRGYFVDIFDSNGEGAWKSLCERTIFCQPGNFTADEEGAVTTSVTQGALPSASPSGTPSGPSPLHLPETMFRWNGESLAVPRPEAPPSQDLPGGRPSQPSPVGVAITAKKRGKRPPLRFGHTYKVRMRKVDLAGNAVPAQSQSDSQSDLQKRFARLEPVNPPVLRPRDSATPGESIERLVVRSPLASGESCIRILMAPECSQQMAERHGMFDDKMGQPLDENQTQPWLAERIPNAEAHTSGPVKKSDVFNAMIPKSNTPEYLSDPMAAGVLCRPVIDGAQGADGVSIQLPFAPVTLFGHDWPRKQVVFIVKPAARNDQTPVDLIPKVSNDTFILDLPQAEVRRFWLSSLIALDPEDPQNHLPLFAVYNWLQEAHAAGAAKLARSGVCWMLMPYREITVVHAVPQPLDLPFFVGLALDRRHAGDTFASLSGKLHVHAKSTVKAEIEALWYEFIDDPLQDAPVQGAHRSVRVCHFHVEMPRNAALPQKVKEPPENLIDINEKGKTVIQSFGDTKYRRVFYTAIATSRFAEYWDPKDINSPKDFTCKSEPELQSVPSTARPAAPKVLYVVPAFKWLSSADGWSSTREGGWLRIYLDRPWFSSGEGEKLGVVLGQQPLAQPLTEQQKLVTFWGSDPVWPSDEPPGNPFLSGSDFNDVVLEEGAKVNLKVHDVQWDSSRKLWFCDVQVDVSSTYFPFVRLALVRFQEHSLSVKGEPDLRVSRVVLTEPVQVFPTRTLSVEPEQSDASPGQVALVITVEGKTHKSPPFPNTFEVYVETTQTGAAPSSEFDWIPTGTEITLGVPSPNSDQLWTGFWPGVATVPGKSGIPLRVVVKEMEHYKSPADWSDAASMESHFRVVYADAFQI